METPKASYSRRARPRPKPKWSVPRLSWLSIAISPASLSGLYQGRTKTQVPRSMSGMAPGEMGEHHQRARRRKNSLRSGVRSPRTHRSRARRRDPRPPALRRIAPRPTRRGSPTAEMTVPNLISLMAPRPRRQPQPMPTILTGHRKENKRLVGIGVASPHGFLAQSIGKRRADHDPGENSGL